jgi:hypothetical protein
VGGPITCCCWGGFYFEEVERIRNAKKVHNDENILKMESCDIDYESNTQSNSDL